MKVLLIEDNESVLSVLKSELQGHDLTIHDSLADYDIESLSSDTDLVLLDLMSSKDPDAEKTISLIPVLKQKIPNAEIWVQSGSEDLTLMRRCVEAGAFRFLLKEHLLGELPVILEWCFERRKRREALEKIIVGETQLIQNLRMELLSLLSSDIDVLIEGESGTGKELCAQAFAQKSKPFVAVNVSAIPKELFEGELFGYEKGAFSGASSSKEGFFEAANGGVLFLDEIQSLSLDLQAKILRVLETRSFRRLGSVGEKKFECRVVCAANRNLKEASKRGEFREDLFYRIAPVTLSIPPLRVRSDDIPLIATHLLKKLDPQGKIKIDEYGYEILKKYDWPGNVRELSGIMKALYAKARIPIWGQREFEEVLKLQEPKLNVKASQEAFQVDFSVGLDQNLQNLEKWMLIEVLKDTSGVEARERLGLKRSRFYEKLKLHSLLKEDLE